MPELPIVDAPEQSARADWYGQYRACFAMFDGKHAITGWRTGRAYHALLAGIPVASPTGNPALAWTWQTESPRQLAALLKLTPEEREDIHGQQVKASNAQMLLNASFVQLGL
jgi:hypothetical protein